MRKPDFTRRVAVTGMGLVSPIGDDVDTVWSNLVDGVSGLKRITYWDPEPYDCKVAGEVPDFDPAAWMNFKEARRTDRNVVLGVAASKKALAHSGLEVTDANRDDIGVYFGSGGGGPRPRNDSAVTVKIVFASVRLVCTRIGETTSGSTCRTAMVNSPTPMLRAASTWSHRLTLSTGPRTTRASVGV